MRKMIDFTACPVNKFKAYGGGNGNKIGILYEGEHYMLKFAPKDLKKSLYTNACMSEYLACNIYETMGFKVQRTLLGTYRYKGNSKEVVACKDFETDGYKLMEFAKIKNACLGNSNEYSNGYGTEINSVLEAICEQQLVPSEKLKKFFWDMFIADAFLGNFDRHNGNWGILIHEALQKAEIAPIYDCGSCLYSQIEENAMQKVLSDPEQQDMRVFVFPTSALKYHDKKINYFDFISNNTNQDCTDALFRVTTKINMGKIEKFICSVPSLSETQKNFYISMLEQRKAKILDFSLEKIKAFENKICSGAYRLQQLYLLGEETFNWDKATTNERIQLFKRNPRFKIMQRKGQDFSI